MKTHSKDNSLTTEIELEDDHVNLIQSDNENPGVDDAIWLDKHEALEIAEAILNYYTFGKKHDTDNQA